MEEAVSRGYQGITTDLPQPDRHPSTPVRLDLTELEAVDLLHGTMYLVHTCEWPVDRLVHAQELLETQVPIRMVQDRISGPMEPLPQPEGGRMPSRNYELPVVLIASTINQATLAARKLGIPAGQWCFCHEPSNLQGYTATHIIIARPLQAAGLHDLDKQAAILRAAREIATLEGVTITEVVA
jgi:hypothetical protein